MNIKPSAKIVLFLGVPTIVILCNTSAAISDAVGALKKIVGILTNKKSVA